MKGTVNMKGVQEQGEYILIPEGQYLFEIAEVVDKYSANGDPLVSIKLVIKNGAYSGNRVWDNILIPSLNSAAVKILGRTKHLLHCIGEQYEGEEVVYDSDNWEGQEVYAEVGHELPNSYHKKTKPVINQYILEEEIKKEPKSNKDEEVPF